MKGTTVSIISVLILFLDSSWICSAYDVLGKIPKEFSTTGDWSKLEVTPFLEVSFKPNDFYNIKRELLLTFNDTQLKQLQDITGFPAKISQEIDNHIAASFDVAKATSELTVGKPLSYNLQLMHSLPHPKDWDNKTFVKEFFHLPTFTFDEAQRAGMNMTFMYEQLNGYPGSGLHERFENNFREWIQLMISAPSTWSESYITSLTPKDLTTHIYKLLSGKQIIELKDMFLEMDGFQFESSDVVLHKLMGFSKLTSINTNVEVETFINQTLLGTPLVDNLMKEHLNGLAISPYIDSILKDSLESRAGKKSLSGQEVYTKVHEFLQGDLPESALDLYARFIFDKIPKSEFVKQSLESLSRIVFLYMDNLQGLHIHPWALNKIIYLSSRLSLFFESAVDRIYPDNLIPIIPFDEYFSKWNTNVYVKFSKDHKIYTPMQKTTMLSQAFLEDTGAVLSGDLADSLYLTHNYLSTASVAKLRELVKLLSSASPLGMYAMEKRMEDVTELTPGDLKSTLEPRYLVPSTVALINQSFILLILCEFEELKVQPIFTTCVALKNKLVTFYRELYSESTMTELQLMKKLSTADIEYLPLGVIAALGTAALDGASTDMKIMLTAEMAARDYSFSIPRYIRARIVSNGLLAMNYSKTTGMTVNNVDFLIPFAVADISKIKLWKTRNVTAIIHLLTAFDTLLQQSQMFCIDHEQMGVLAELLKRVKGNNPSNWKHLEGYCCILMMLTPEELDLLDPEVLSQCYCPSHSGGMSPYDIDMFESSCDAESDGHHTLMEARENLVTAHKKAIKSIMIKLLPTHTRRRRDTDDDDDKKGGITTRHEARDLGLCDEADLFGGTALYNLHVDDFDGHSSETCIRSLGSMPIHEDAMMNLNKLIKVLFDNKFGYKNISELNYGLKSLSVADLTSKLPAINNRPLIEALGRTGRFNKDQLTYLGKKMMNDLTSTMNEYTTLQILAAGDLMCGIDVDQYEKIKNDEFRETVWALGQLDCLTDAARKALAKKAIVVFGNVNAWSQGQVAQINSIIGGMDPSDMAKLSVGGAAGVTPSAIEVMSEDTLSSLVEDGRRLENIPLPSLQALSHGQIHSLSESLQLLVEDRLALAGGRYSDIISTCDKIRKNGMDEITAAQVKAMLPAEVTHCVHWMGKRDNFGSSVLNIIAAKITTFTDDLTELSKRQVTDMGYVIRGFNPGQLKRFPKLNELEYLKVLGTNWHLSADQIVSLATKMETEYNKSSLLTSEDLTAANQIICGITDSNINKINDEAFAGALPTISVLGTCSSAKMRVLLLKGLVPIRGFSRLDATDVRNLGNLMSVMQPLDVLMIPPLAFGGLSPAVITLMSPLVVTVFTVPHILALKKETAMAISIPQKLLFTIPKHLALAAVLMNPINTGSAAHRHLGDLQFTGVMAVFFILALYNKFAVNLF